MRTIRIVLLSFTLIVFIQINDRSLVNAQGNWFDRIDIEDPSTPFNNLLIYKTITLPSGNPNLTQLTCYIKIANDLFQFVQQDTIYIAQYELMMSIQKVHEESVTSKITKNKITAMNFMETNSRDLFSNLKFDFLLSPGEYKIFIEITDLETRNPLNHEDKIILPDFYARPVSATEILFFHADNTDALFPVFPAVYSQQDSILWAKCYIQSNMDSSQTISIKKIILNKNDQPVAVDSFYLQLDSTITPVVIELENPLDFGQYTLLLEMFNDRFALEISESFYIRWAHHSTWIPNLDELVETMRYIMDSAQWEQLIHLSKDQQEKMIETFWQERDPVPMTEENELEDEYFRRIAVSNQYFSTWREDSKGWQTDRGRIYITYGEPSLVENPSSLTDDFNRYEIWIYNHLQKRFVFIDRLGSGNYQLIAEEQL